MVGIVEALLVGIQLLTVVLVGVIGYFARRTLTQVEKNTRFRRVISGDEEFGDGDGRLGEFDSLHEQLREDHEEVRRRLIDLHHVVHELVEAIDESDEMDVDVDIDIDGSPYDSEFRGTD